MSVLYLKKITEPISNNTSKKDVNRTSFIVKVAIM